MIWSFKDGKVFFFFLVESFVKYCSSILFDVFLIWVYNVVFDSFVVFLCGILFFIIGSLELIFFWVFFIFRKFMIRFFFSFNLWVVVLDMVNFVMDFVFWWCVCFWWIGVVIFSFLLVFFLGLFFERVGDVLEIFWICLVSFLLEFKKGDFIFVVIDCLLMYIGVRIFCVVLWIFWYVCEYW